MCVVLENLTDFYVYSLRSRCDASMYKCTTIDGQKSSSISIAIPAHWIRFKAVYVPFAVRLENAFLVLLLPIYVGLQISHLTDSVVKKIISRISADDQTERTRDADQREMNAISQCSNLENVFKCFMMFSTQPETRYGSSSLHTMYTTPDKQPTISVDAVRESET